MKLSKIVDAVNAKSFGETNWTYSDIYPYFSQAITEINGELDSFRQIENAPDVTENTPYYNIAAYSAIPDTHILNYIVTYIVVAMDNAQLAVTSRTQSYVTQLAKYKQQLIADLYKWMPIREDSNIYFDLEHNGKDTRRIPYVGNCWYDEDEGGMLSCNEDSEGHYHVLPSIGVHCDNPYGYLVPRDTTQRILEGRYNYNYIFVPYEAFRPYYDPVGVRIAITGYDIPYTAIPYTTIEHLDVETITNSKGDTIVVFKNFNMRNKTISNVNVDTPTSDTHPTTKKYVDDSITETINYVDTTDANMKAYVDGKNELDEKVANKTSSWGSTPSDTKYPTEKLVKDSLDLKENLSNKTASWGDSVSNTKYPTEKLVKDTLDLKEDISNKITQWGGNPSDMQYPSAKLTKDTLDTKFNNANIIAESSGITNDTDKVLSSKAVNTIKTDLQNQIDGINAGQNLADIVATKAALSNLDRTKLRDNDKVQVLADEDYDNASTVYSFTSPNTFTYIGKYGQDSYSKSETYNKTELDGALNGKQNVINAQNPLDATLVNTDSTHRFVTDSDKTNWNGKLDASNVGIVTISADSGTLTSAQLTECNKNIAVVVYGNKRYYKTAVKDNRYYFRGDLYSYTDDNTNEETILNDLVVVDITTGQYVTPSTILLECESISSAEISALFS